MLVLFFGKKIVFDPHSGLAILEILKIWHNQLSLKKGQKYFV